MTPAGPKMLGKEKIWGNGKRTDTEGVDLFHSPLGSLGQSAHMSAKIFFFLFFLFLKIFFFNVIQHLGNGTWPIPSRTARLTELKDKPRGQLWTPIIGMLGIAQYSYGE